MWPPMYTTRSSMLPRPDSLTGAVRVIEQRITTLLEAITGHAKRYRIIYTLLALVIFAGGLWLSVRSLELNNLDLQFAPLLVNLLIGAPTAIALNAVGFQLAGRIIHTNVGFVNAYRICAVATASNVLPIPAGTVFQSAALTVRGATIGRSGGIIVLGNLASLAIVAALVGAILSSELPLLGAMLVVISLCVLTIACMIVWRLANTRTATTFLALRLARTLVLVLRIQLSFMIIGLSVPLFEAAAMSGAVALGTTVALFPAGLGISESLAALTAMVLSVSSAAAFLTTAVNRMTTIVYAAVAGSVLSIFTTKMNHG